MHNHKMRLTPLKLALVAISATTTVAIGAPLSAKQHAYGTNSNRSASTSGDGTTIVIAKAEPLHAFGYASGTIGDGADNSGNQSASGGAIFELQASGGCPGSTFSWGALGWQGWKGAAQCATTSGDATVECKATLAFQGDLGIRNACMVKCSDSQQSTTAYSAEVPLKFGVTYSRTRNQTVKTDGEEGSQTDSNSGNGTKARVDTTTKGDASIDLNTQVWWWSKATAAGAARIVGLIQLKMVVTCNCTVACDTHPSSPGGSQPPVVLTGQETWGNRLSTELVTQETTPPLLPKPGVDHNDD